jgi:hypothetical protein
MWHSIAAGVRAARLEANLEGKPHAQFEEGEDDDVDDDSARPDRERIAVEYSHGNGNGNGNDDDGAAPHGGYQDPFNDEKSSWFRRRQR